VTVTAERVSLTYRAVMTLATPAVRWWGRLEVHGLAALPGTGPVIIFANHDSHWDPLVIGVAARGRQVRALAKASLWKSRPLAWVLNHMGQIPIERGRGDLTAMSAALDALRAGGCLGIFPEGTISRGEATRPLSGAGRLALAVPEARLVCVAASGAVDLVRFPRRPRLRVEFFAPESGQPQPGETPIRLTRRLMAEIRERAPFAAAGRRTR
jgi:1-acyl-sn-glycerol-3-phosphate acyltransferase